MEQTIDFLKEIFILFFICIVIAKSNGENIFDVTKYGAIPDGKTDASEALMKTWEDACGKSDDSMVIIPEGKFMVNRATFQGPCKAPIQFVVNATVMAPLGLDGVNDSWIKFRYVDGMSFSGVGVFDGQGASVWKHNDCKTNKTCVKLPINLRFDFVTNSTIKGITSLNSKSAHINVFACENVAFKSITIKAPKDSPNTDGIHMGGSSSISISDSTIATGDDCVSFSPGIQNVSITNVTCGPGHGISIGSLGGTPNEKSVTDIVVKNCTFSGTTNGARIKTWPSSYPNLVRNVTFQDIIISEVQNPIVIDQWYCPSNKCNKNAPSKVQIENIHYTNIRGFSLTQLSVDFDCSGDLPCQNINLQDIDLRYNGKDGTAKERCLNAKGTSSGYQNPPSCLN